MKPIMKNIFYITYSAIPSELPSSLQIIKTCESLIKNKNLVTLVKPGTGSKKESIKKYYGIKENIKIKEFSNIKNFPQGIEFYLYSFYCLFYILRKKKPIIITRNYFICYLLLLFRKKVILEIHHDTNIEGKIIKLLLKYTNFLNKKSLINIIAISNSVKSLFIKKYLVEAKKITVLPSGSSIKVSKFPGNIYNKRLKIGYFGSISSSKGIKTLIKLSKIDLKNDYYIFGGNKKQIQKLRTQNINRNLFFSAHVAYKSLPKIMMKMDILTIPYTKKLHSAGEVDDISKFTSPLKLFDYLAVGKIIISSNLEVLREVIGHKNAYLINNFENIFEWKKNIEIAKNNKIKNLIICKNNLILSKKFDHIRRVKKYI
tara:strand:- start:212 stop:1327 length:1116 start_codon:yes stop_codon:yes gene_type:complete